jgi:hypothetical protein
MPPVVERDAVMGAVVVAGAYEQVSAKIILASNCTLAIPLKLPLLPPVAVVAREREPELAVLLSGGAGSAFEVCDGEVESVVALALEVRGGGSEAAGSGTFEAARAPRPVVAARVRPASASLVGAVEKGTNGTKTKKKAKTSSQIVPLLTESLHFFGLLACQLLGLALLLLLALALLLLLLQAQLRPATCSSLGLLLLPIRDSRAA